MAQLIVCDIDAELVLALQRRAAQHGCSAEAKHRQILRDALAGDLRPTSFKEFLSAMPNMGEDADVAALRDLPRDVEL